MAKIITGPGKINFSVEDLPPLPEPRAVLMATPDYFTVDYVINPYMEQHIGKVDPKKAYHQWEEIRRTFQSLGLDVHVIQGQEALPDMVFCANQSLPYITEKGHKKVVMSIMHAKQREKEVPFLEQWYRQHGYQIFHIENEEVSKFEGMGDALWHFGRRLLWGGYGFRTDPKAYPFIADLFEVPVIMLELTSDRFYHLDTCFNILNNSTALVHPEAFTEQSFRLIDALFDRLIIADKEEAVRLFACNVVCPDGRNVVIQKGCDITNQRLADAGFIVHQVDTSEFLKSGGSVFCMKMLLW